MMRIQEARAQLQRIVHHDAWMKRVVSYGGGYSYEAGIGTKVLVDGCFSPEQCLNLASLRFDLTNTGIDEVAR